MLAARIKCTVRADGGCDYFHTSCDAKYRVGAMCFEGVMDVLKVYFWIPNKMHLRRVWVSMHDKPVPPSVRVHVTRSTRTCPTFYEGYPGLRFDDGRFEDFGAMDGLLNQLVCHTCGKAKKPYYLQVHYTLM